MGIHIGYRPARTLRYYQITYNIAIIRCVNFGTIRRQERVPKVNICQVGQPPSSDETEKVVTCFENSGNTA